MNSVIYGRIWAVVGLILLGGIFQTNAKQYYKWVDANGVTTYSATPPPTHRSNEPQLASQKMASLSQNKPTSTSFKSNATIADEYYSPYKQSSKQAAPPVVTEKENPVKVNKTETNQSIVHTTASAKKQSYMIKQCNGVRCSDDKGNNYNKVTGNTYLSSRGGVCQMNKNRMECNK